MKPNKISDFFKSLKKECLSLLKLRNKQQPDTKNWWDILTRLGLTYDRFCYERRMISDVESFFSQLNLPKIPSELLSTFPKYDDMRKMLRLYPLRLSELQELSDEDKDEKENIYRFEIGDKPEEMFQCRCYLPDENHVPILEITIPSDKDVPDTVVFYERNQAPFGKIVILKYKA